MTGQKSAEALKQQRKAVQEGAKAKRDGYTGRNPYTKGDGTPIPAFRVMAEAWQRGFDAGL
jgi:hypothetical protein